MRLFYLMFFIVFLLSCSFSTSSRSQLATPIPQIPTAEIDNQSASTKVLASHYDRRMAGNKTASGEIYDPSKFTCAHKTLPFGTIVKVKNQKNQKIAFVKVNDRGPFIRGREIDLSNAAAEKLSMDGVQTVEIELVRLALKAGL